MTRNPDSKDFRRIVDDSRQLDCAFCSDAIKQEIIIENDYAYVKADKFPVTKGHSLIIPKRHIPQWFDSSELERKAMDDLLFIRRRQLTEEDGSIEGFNIGMNCGEVAGQTIFHCHIHLIPRRKGDIDFPRGGVRGVIHSKMRY